LVILPLVYSVPTGSYNIVLEGMEGQESLEL